MNTLLAQCAQIFHRLILVLFLFSLVSFTAPQSVVAACLPSPTDMVSWWKGDGDAIDSSDSNPGTLTNGTTFTTGRIDQAFGFDGINDYVRVTDNVNLQFPNTEFSLSTWFKTPSIAGSQILFSKGVSDANEEYTVSIDAGGGVYWDYGNHVNGYVRTFSGVTANQWTHLTVTYNNSTNPKGKIYLNGVNRTLDVNGGGSHIVNSGSDLFIGTQNANSIYYGGRTPFNGQIDDFRIFNRSLTPQEALNLYNEGAGSACVPSTSRSDTLSRQTISSLSNHTIAYTTPGGVAAGETMTITFPSGFSIPGSLDYTDIDVSYGPTTGLENELTIGSSASGATWGTSFSGQVLTIISGTGTIPTSSRIVVEVGTHAITGVTGDQQITNPATAGSYLITLGGTYNENGEIGIPITQTDQVTSTGVAGPTIAFDIDAATSDSETDGPHAVALGTLSPSTLSTSRTDGVGTIKALFFDLSTNALSGATVSIKGVNGGLLSATTNSTITLSSSESAIVAGQAQFGVCLSSLTASSGTLLAHANYDANGTANCTSTNGGTPTVGKIQTTASPLFTSASAPVSAGRAALLFKSSISTLTPGAFDYSETLTFIAVGTF